MGFLLAYLIKALKNSVLFAVVFIRIVLVRCHVRGLVLIPDFTVGY